MDKKEFKKITKEWFISKGFIKGTDGIDYIYTLQGFNIYILFVKSRFDEKYHFQIGFKIDNVQAGSGDVRVAIPSEKYWEHLTMADGSKIVGKCYFQYEEWEKEEYLKTLEDIYQIYIQPYFDNGLKHWKKILKDGYEDHGMGSYRGELFTIGRAAREMISKL